MTYLITQIWFYLLITACAAGGIGWFLRGSNKKKLQALEQQWQADYESVDSERKSYAKKIEQLSKIEHENKELKLRVALQRTSFDEAIEHLKKQIKTPLETM